MSAVTPKITLIAYTPDPEKVIATAARLCYSSDDIATIQQGVGAPKMIKQLLSSGHESPLEHASFTFGIEGVSRAFLAQITRHRIASFSVQSQRYVNQSDFDYVMPPEVQSQRDKHFYEQHMRTMAMWYKDMMLEGVDKEDARFVMPNAAATRMIVTMNARELRHFFSLRCCNRAQWEIRNVAWEMWKQVYEIAPHVFINPVACIAGKCPEGKRTCGKAEEARQKYAEGMGDI